MSRLIWIYIVANSAIVVFGILRVKIDMYCLYSKGKVNSMKSDQIARMEVLLNHINVPVQTGNQNQFQKHI